MTPKPHKMYYNTQMLCESGDYLIKYIIISNHQNIPKNQWINFKTLPYYHL